MTLKRLYFTRIWWPLGHILPRMGPLKRAKHANNDDLLRYYSDEVANFLPRLDIYAASITTTRQQIVASYEQYICYKS